MSWSKEEDGVGLVCHCNVPLVEMGELVRGSRLCLKKLEGGLLAILPHEDSGTVDNLKAMNEKAGGDVGAAIGGNPGVRSRLDDPVLLELLEEGLLVVHVHPELVVALSKEEEGSELLILHGGLGSGVRGQLYHSQTAAKVLEVLGRSHGNLPAVHILGARLELGENLIVHGLEPLGEGSSEVRVLSKWCYHMWNSPG